MKIGASAVHQGLCNPLAPATHSPPTHSPDVIIGSRGLGLSPAKDAPVGPIPSLVRRSAPHGRRGGGVQFWTPTPAAWARGPRGGGGSIFFGFWGALLKSPFHSEHFEDTIVMGFLLPFPNNTGGKWGDAGMLCPSPQGQNKMVRTLLAPKSVVPQ